MDELKKDLNSKVPKDEVEKLIDEKFKGVNQERNNLSLDGSNKEDEKKGENTFKEQVQKLSADISSLREEFTVLKKQDVTSDLKLGLEEEEKFNAVGIC